MRIVLTLVIAIAFGSASAGAERRQLPAFSVVAADGVPAASSQLGVPGRWLLVYITPGCVPCDRLLTSLDGWGVLQQGAGRAVVVVDGSGESLAARVRTLMPTAGNTVRVYSDVERRAATALSVTRAPFLIGVEDGVIDWTVGGVLNDPKAVETLVRSWLAR